MEKFPNEQSAIDYLAGILWNVVIDMIDRLRSLVRVVVGKRLTYRMLVHGI